jgi:hypothetical protein
MSGNREQRIREEAYLLWNADGRPEGKSDEYWHRAEKVIDDQDKLAEQEKQRGEM